MKMVKELLANGEVKVKDKEKNEGAKKFLGLF